MIEGKPAPVSRKGRTPDHHRLKEALSKEPPGNALVFPLARRDIFSSRRGLFYPPLFQKK
ncbi:hypothetical protein KL86DES1_21026 [uncultured Desulfovibrio sp.]|uniref:Uncharacterized protein n=1 Tax=uncultured Desulfovibrio sp. TaxID=167968 RepID=A0A212L686_9BACT|nr:hypothetical protein KL86DES1_21026 [uncultured Desulfovibrio sp.]VZH33926.1 conserved protein of unknown function [Desulfovibrio sp. 86]